MSYCRNEGKDKIMFVTKEDDQQPSKSTGIFSGDLDDEPGLILPDGQINWSCPCLGGMATGPCGFEFREAFSCFHYSESETKGSDCYDQFSKMQQCMSKYPQLYDDDDKEDKKDDDTETKDIAIDSTDKDDEKSVTEKAS